MSIKNMHVFTLTAICHLYFYRIFCVFPTAEVLCSCGGV